MGGLHPLAPGGMGWTPGGSHVGEIEDLIVEGLPVGNLFGFAWNLLVSVCFQFVGESQKERERERVRSEKKNLSN